MFIGRDYRTTAIIPGQLVITVQAIAESRETQRFQQSILEDFEGLALSNTKECFIVEDHVLELNIL